MINNRQGGRRRGRGGQQARNGQPNNPHSGSRLDNRQRGNAAQLLEKYKTLARDAQMVGDRVNTEYYLQFADHYFRVLSENRSRFEEQRPPQRRDEFGQEYGTEDEGGDGQRGYPQRDGGEDGWDDGEDDQPQQAQPQQHYPQQHQPRDNREPRDGRDQREPREARDTREAREAREPREAREQRELREPREQRSMEPRGERRPRGNNGGEANGQRPAANAPAPAAPASTGNAPEAAPVDSVAPRIDFDRLPPALTPAVAPSAVDEQAPTLDLGEAPAPKRRRTRKPKVADDAAPAEA